MVSALPPAPLGADGCPSFHVGHNVHFIQAKLGWRSTPTPATITALDQTTGVLTLATPDGERRLWTHDPARVAELVDRLGPEVGRTAHSALVFPTDGVGQPHVSVATLEAAAPCLPKEATTGLGGVLIRPTDAPDDGRTFGEIVLEIMDSDGGSTRPGRSGSAHSPEEDA